MQTRRNSFILNCSGKSAHVSASTPEVEALSEVPIVDVTIAYDCPHMMECFILVFHNALSVSSMEHNMIPPFILREAGIKVSDAPKIHVKNLTLNDQQVCVLCRCYKGMLRQLIV